MLPQQGIITSQVTILLRTFKQAQVVSIRFYAEACKTC
jgi:hypothetical protein